MKYLLLLIVIGLAAWMLTKRLRGGGAAPDRPPARSRAGRTPVAMVECAHCGLHLPAADAVLDGRHVYCGETHRRLGPRPDDS